MAVFIVDREGEQSRLLSMDDSGIHEAPLGSLEAMAGEVASYQPDLILVNQGALAIGVERLVNELNRLGQFEPGYSWSPAVGETEA